MNASAVALDAEFPGGILDARLLPLAFKRPHSTAPLSVLDIGMGRAESVRFLSRFCARLAYADLYGELENGDYRRSPAQGKRPIDRAERFLASRSGETFDVVLLGDFLNYLSEDDMRRFGLLLRKHLNSGAKAHGFAAFTHVSPFQGLRLNTLSLDRLAITAEPEETPHRHTQKVIARILWPLSVTRSVLQADNRKEVLLESCR